jgi:hypothetical protein
MCSALQSEAAHTKSPSLSLFSSSAIIIILPDLKSNKAFVKLFIDIAVI